jgi:hypothetical protein
MTNCGAGLLFESAAAARLRLVQKGIAAGACRTVIPVGLEAADTAVLFATKGPVAVSSTL